MFIKANSVIKKIRNGYSNGPEDVELVLEHSRFIKDGSNQELFLKFMEKYGREFGWLRGNSNLFGTDAINDSNGREDFVRWVSHHHRLGNRILHGLHVA